MKLMTINTHSLIEKNYEKKLKYFIDYLLKNEYDIIAMQEVNQSINEIIVTEDSHYIPPTQNISIKKDNHIYNIIKELKNKGKSFYWTWIPIKLGYGIYDEGIGILSKKKPVDVVEFSISKNSDYNNWKTRKVIGIKIKENDTYSWYFSIHSGWWHDNDEPFIDQFKKLEKELNHICKKEEKIFLMGDFNNPSQLKGEGYDYVISSGWYDTYTLAKTKDDGISVSGLIDGWKEHKELTKMRIDFIFTNKKIDIKSSEVVFNGKKENIISDHFGIKITM